MSSSYTFSIIIVSWNTRILTLEAIQSVLDQNFHEIEIIVVDNASTDGTVRDIKAYYPQVKLIVNEKNVGYAKANNQGMSEAKGKYYILLNSDAQIISKNTFNIIKYSFDHDNSLGILGGQLVLPDGRIQAYGRSFLTLNKVIKQQILFSSKVKKATDNQSKIKEVDYVDGAFLAIPRFTVETIGLLREEFFMYAEDMEWCARVKRSGWRVKVRQDIVVRHIHAASTKQNLQKLLTQSAVNICRFIREYEGVQKAKLAYDVFIIGMLLRVFTSVVRRNKQALSYLNSAHECIKNRRSVNNMLEEPV